MPETSRRGLLSLAAATAGAGLAAGRRSSGEEPPHKPVLISGTVTDTAGKPIDGIEVKLYSGTEQYPSTRTAKDGSYSFELPNPKPNSPVQVHYHSSRHQPDHMGILSERNEHKVHKVLLRPGQRVASADKLDAFDRYSKAAQVLDIPLTDTEPLADASARVGLFGVYRSQLWNLRPDAGDAAFDMRAYRPLADRYRLAWFPREAEVRAALKQSGSVLEFLSASPYLSTFFGIASRDDEQLVRAMSKEAVTVFAPTNDAFDAAGDFTIRLMSSATDRRAFLAASIITARGFAVEELVKCQTASSFNAPTVAAAGPPLNSPQAYMVMAKTMGRSAVIIRPNIQCPNGYVHIVNKLTPFVEGEAYER